jgi:soluble cytochrome b562
MTKTALQDQLRKAGVPFKAKATKAELQEMLSKANGQTKPTTKKNKAGAKQVLRDRFTQHGVVTVGQIDKIASKLNVQPATVRTALSDLQNAKYAGSLGALAIEKDGDSYRLAK